MIFYLLLVGLSLVFYIVTRKFTYWEKKNVPYMKPMFLFGNYKNMLLLKRSWSETVQDICKKFPNVDFIGAYAGTEPVFIPIAPDIIKIIMTKDFYYFNARDVTEYDPSEATKLNIFLTFGDNWKVLRKNLTPLFSSAKMKNMFYLIQKSSISLENRLNQDEKISKELEVKTMANQFTMDCIGACVFGIDYDSMSHNGKYNIFAKIANTITNMPKYEVFQRLLFFIWPNLFFFIKPKVLDRTLPFLMNVVKSVLSERQNRPSGKNDFVDLVLSWKQRSYIIGDSIKTGEEKKVKIEVTDDLLASQCLAFFIGGYETSSTTLCHILYELANHENIQNKVLDEIDAYLLRHKNKLEYDCITELPYTQAVLDEVLRRYPLIGVITRRVVEDYELPNGLRLEKGLRVHIPVYHLHHDPKYFPNPYEFRPERFLGNEKNNIKPYTYMPFGEGLRTCIGMRFAKMQIFAGLVTVLKKYRVEMANGMPTRLKFIPYLLLWTPVVPIKLKMIERNGCKNRVYAQN